MSRMYIYAILFIGYQAIKDEAFAQESGATLLNTVWYAVLPPVKYIVLKLTNPQPLRHPPWRQSPQ